MKLSALISLHEEYGHRFKIDFQQLLEQLTFSEVVLRNSDLLFDDEDAPFYHTLRHCFNCSFESMALGLSRIWDEDQKVSKDGRHLNLISIPMLANRFVDQDFFGCIGMKIGGSDRALFDRLYSDPLRKLLRVVRTEALAHSIMIGKSRDRKNSEVEGMKEFGVKTGDALTYCRETLHLLFSLNDQLTLSKWRAKKSMDDMASEWESRHIGFLKSLVVQVK